MAKPVLIVKIPFEAPEEVGARTQHQMEKKMGDEYHILVCRQYVKDIVFECYNDCKGLPDADIERMIIDYKELLKQHEA